MYITPQPTPKRRSTGWAGMVALLLCPIVCGGMWWYMVGSQPHVPTTQELLQQNQKDIEEAKANVKSLENAYPAFNGSTYTPSGHDAKARNEETEKLKVIVDKGHTFTVDGDYDYLRGSIKNNSSRVVTYWKASATFYDKNGNIIDTAYTNSNETLLPGAAKRYEIMHSHALHTMKASVYVEDVSFEP